MRRRIIVFLSSHAADPESDARLARWHGEAEDVLRASRMAWTTVRCGAFATNLLFFAQQVRGRGVLTSWPRSDARIAVLDPQDIAAVALAALTQPGHKGKTHLLTGPESLSMLDQTAILGEVLGRTLVYEALPDRVLLHVAHRLGMADNADAFVRQLRADGTGLESQPVSTLRDVTGRAPRTFRQWGRRPRERVSLMPMLLAIPGTLCAPSVSRAKAGSRDSIGLKPNSPRRCT